jgi:hypothetical protein
MPMGQNAVNFLWRLIRVRDPLLVELNTELLNLYPRVTLYIEPW